MEILFNNHKQGQIELTNALGFLDSDFDFNRMLTDIKLVTPELIEFVSEETYKKLIEIYKDLPELTSNDGENYGINIDSLEEEQKLNLQTIQLVQVYLAINAYYNFAANNDLMHTTSGRKMNKADDETTPWDWQIAADNAALMKKAYKALDQLIISLDKSELKEWMNSEAYKTSKSLFVYKTSIFNKRYPINNSEQLYYRLVPFMQDFELVEICSRLGEDLYTRLKESITPAEDFTELSTDEKALLILVEYAIVHLTLAKAYKVFPIEMFPDKINYRENTKMKSQARAEVMTYLQEEAQAFLLKIEKEVEKLNREKEPLIKQETQTENLTPGLNQDTNYVDL